MSDVEPTFESANAEAIFPTIVWQHRLREEDYRPLNDRLVDALETLRAGASPLRPGELAQTEPNLHTLPAFAGLMPYLGLAGQGVLDHLAVEYAGFEITGCWANIAAPGAPHKFHTHPNNYLSGVYYVRVPDGGSTITFTDPRPQPMVIAPRVREDNDINGGKVIFEVAEGALLVFPAWLSHSVDPNQGAEQRISISFNIMFSDFAETVSPPRWAGMIEGRS